MAEDQEFVMVSHSDTHSQMSEEETKKILEWLAPTEYSVEGSEFQKHVQAHVPGTSSWIFETTQYKKWLQPSDVGTLWIKGVPGSGKSIVAANLIKTLSEKDTGLPVMYFFFRNIINTNSHPRYLTRDFLAQLLPYSLQLGSTLKRLMLKHSDVESVPATELWETFVTSLSSCSQALIVVDALDEIEEGEEAFVTDTLLELGRLKPESVKLVVTSRPLSILENPSVNSNTSILRLLGKVVDQDISTYISYRLGSQDQREFTQEERNAINAYLCGEQPGLFLQARLVLDELLRGEESAEKMLARSLHSMSQIYQNILSEHSLRTGASQELQVHVLEWITHASRPLRLLELAEILLSQGIFPDIHSAKSMLKVCCGPLLEVLDNETLSVIHHSFTEFLLDPIRIAPEDVEAFPVLFSAAVHAKLASESIYYLFYAFSTYDTKEMSRATDQMTKEHMLKYPFLRYAVQMWPYHFSKGMVAEGKLDDEPIFKKLDLLFKNQGSLEAWLHFCADRQRELMLGGEAIHIASFLGLNEYVEYLLQGGADPNFRYPDGRTPMMCAASQGHSGLVAVIAKAGGNVEATDCLGYTALHHAAVQNRGASIDTLVACGANLMCSKLNDIYRKIIDFHHYDPLPPRAFERQSNLWGANPGQDLILGKTPIKFACEYGCSESVKTLMQHMSSDQRATVGLHLVAQRGYSEVLSILLGYHEVAIKVNEVDCNGNTPLILASRDMNPVVVRILLQAGANTLPVSCIAKEQNQTSYIALGQKRRRTETNLGKTPLDAWAELSNKRAPRDEITLLEDMQKVADMLIQAGCDVDVRSPEGFTPLFRWNDHFSTPAVTQKFVSILLGHGADPNATAQCGSTPLHRMQGGDAEHEAILLLVKAGADINAVRSFDGRTPILNVAFTTNDVPDVKPFIGYGVEFKVCDNSGNSVLHYMVQKSISKHLIEDWLGVCDPKVMNKLGETCLFALCHRWPGQGGLESIISQIRAQGVSVETKNIFGRTALMEACCEGENDHIRAFLTAGADARVRDNQGRTCLHLLLAAQASRTLKQLEHIIRELISAGSDPKAIDFSGNHLIHSAVWSRKYTMGRLNTADPIKAAIGLGGDFKAQNYAGQTALHVAAAKRLDTKITGGFDIARLEVLLEGSVGMPLSAKDRDGLTPAHLAAASSEAILFKLISAGADVRAMDFRDRMPLHFAAANLSNTTDMLCDIYSTNFWGVDDQDIKGRTPLHEAASSGNYEAVVVLLEHGAKPSQVDGLQKSPLHFAAAFRRAGIVESKEEEFYGSERVSSKRVAEGIYLGSPERLQRPLGLWLEDELDQRNACDVVSVLLDSGADASLVDYLGRTAHDVALLHGNENVAELLATSRTMTSNSTAITKFPDVLAQRWFSSNSRNTSYIISSLPLGGAEKSRYLESAVYLGSTTLLKSLLGSGIDPGELREGKDGFTIVHAVVCTGQVSMMKTLAPYIGDINSFYPPLLHLAVEREGSNLGIVKLLLELGANANNQYPKPEDLKELSKKQRSVGFPFINECHTVLHKLATGWCWWYPKAIAVLVDKGVNLEATNSQGMTALHLAISGNNHGLWRDQCLDALLSSGADVNTVFEKDGLTPLNMALEGGGGIKTVEKLLKYGADIGAGPNPPLISAIRGADLNGTKLLLDVGANPNGLYGPENRLPLQIAADAWAEDGVGYERGIEGLEEVITLLLESGADPVAEVRSDELGLTKMFHYFCVKNAPITPFIDSEVDLEVRDSADRTPLHAACSYYGYMPQGGMTWVALELISNGADVDAIDSSGDTPLHCTMQTDADVAEVFDALLRDGASVNIQNIAGRTILHYVLKHGEYDIDRKPYLIESLMEKGASPNVGTEDDGATNLHLLAELLAGCVPDEDETSSYFDDYEKFYQQFLDLGCDPEARDNAGDTPAFYFIKTSGPSEAHLRRYLEKCNVQATNVDGDNLLHVVARRQENRNARGNIDAERLFKLLMDLGVDPKRENAVGVSPLDVAATCGKKGILDMFERENQ